AATRGGARLLSRNAKRRGYTKLRMRVRFAVATGRNDGLCRRRRPIFRQRTIAMEAKNLAGKARTGPMHVMSVPVQRAHDFTWTFAGQLEPGFVLTHDASPCAMRTENEPRAERRAHPGADAEERGNFSNTNRVNGKIRDRGP